MILSIAIGYVLPWVFTTTYACPQKCSCRNTRLGIRVSCVSRNILNFPNNIPKATWYLNLENNAICRLHRHNFAGLPKLRILDLANISLSSLDSDTFIDLKNLISLSLSQNKLSVLEKGTFSSLHKLHFLGLASNYLISVDA